MHSGPLWCHLERCCVEHTASWTCRCFVLDVVRCFWGSPLACGGVGHPREPRSRRKMSVHAVSDTCCVAAALELQVSTDSQSNFFFLRRCEPWRTCAITASRARRNRHLSIMLCHGVQCDDLVEAKSIVGMVVVIVARPWVARQLEIVDAARDLKNKLRRHVRQDFFFCFVSCCPPTFTNIVVCVCGVIVRCSGFPDKMHPGRKWFFKHIICDQSLLWNSDIVVVAFICRLFVQPVVMLLCSSLFSDFCHARKARSF